MEASTKGEGMTAQTVELDPVAIRKALVKHRDNGTPWPEAWADATRHHATSTDERSLVAFMERNFRAAYYDTASSLGRCRVAERDTSGAIVKGIPRIVIPSKRDRCRSGDGCDRMATRGSFGKYWCDFHGGELERLADGLAGPGFGGRIFQGAKTRAT